MTTTDHQPGSVPAQLAALAPDQQEAEWLVDGLAAFQAFADRAALHAFKSDANPLFTGQAGRSCGSLYAAVEAMQNALISCHVDGVLGDQSCHDLINLARHEAKQLAEKRAAAESDANADNAVMS